MINISTTGSTGLLISNIEKTPHALDQAAHAGLQRGLQAVVGIAGTKYLTGPRPARLGVRSGRLRSSVTFEIEALADGNIKGRIGSNVKYAAFHEFGFHGVENVRAHTRTVGTSDVAGNPIDERRAYRDRSGNFIGFKDSRAQAAARAGSKTAFSFTQHVRAHSRRVNYPGRPFIKPALQDAFPIIEREINAQIAKAKEQLNG